MEFHLSILVLRLTIVWCYIYESLKYQITHL